MAKQVKTNTTKRKRRELMQALTFEAIDGTEILIELDLGTFEPMGSDPNSWPLEPKALKVYRSKRPTQHTT